jgi:nicotinate-nucleotide pyrophosphorylase (carboxylating)
MKAARQEMPIEIEAQSLDQVDEAIAAGADIILLDNLSIDEVREAVKRIAGRAKTELSGGVTLDRIPELARTGADYVSVGALTHSAPAADLSFELEPEPSVDGVSKTDASKTDLSAGGVPKADV